MPTEAENAESLRQFNAFMAKTGGPAFPYNFTGPGGETSNGGSGMTVRDYFAGEAMKGLLAGKDGPTTPWADHPPSLAATAYLVADAMLAERAKP